MEYPVYSSYIKRANPWFSTIPTDWDVRKIKFSFINKAGSIKTGPFGSQLKSEDMRGSDIKVYNQKNVIRKNLNIGDEYITLKKFEVLKGFEVYDEDLLISTRGTIGKCFVVKKGSEKGILHPCLMRIQFDQHEMLNEFFVYLLEGKGLLLDQLNISSNSTTLEVIYSDTLKNIHAPLPPVRQQQKIAGFLDYKTQQIDQLIEKKKALIEKLNEQRIAVITQAVTKGINKNAKMKPSGVSWLGNIPKHWEALKLKYITKKIIDGAHFTPTYVNEGVPFLRVTDIVKSNGSPINIDIIKYIPQEEHDILYKRCNPEKGDILFSKNGTIGISRVIDWGWKFSVFVSLCLIKPEQNKVSGEYLSSFLESKITQNQIAVGAKSNTVTNLHLDKIKEFIVCLPPKQEQLDILEFLEHELTMVDKMLRINNQTIMRLTEYRSALITAAVTGKIDIRNIKIPGKKATK